MMSRLKRVFPAVILAFGSLALTGCVYLRLLQLKNQLADFERHFEADTRDGLKLAFRKPVLLDEDIEGFLKWIPESREKVGTAERWRFRWVKERVPADGDHAEPYAVELDFLFSERKLAKLIAPEAIFATVMPKSMALGMLRSLGRAKIDQKNRSASATVEERDLENEVVDRPVTRDGLIAMFGQPVEIAGEVAAPEWRYTFTAASPMQRFGRSGGIDVTFTLDATSGRVRRMKGTSMGMSMAVDFGEGGQANGS